MSGGFAQYRATRFSHLKDQLRYQLVHRGVVIEEATTWQSVDVTHKPEMTPVELEAVSLLIPIDPVVDGSVEVWQDNVKPNLPWAEVHFLERVSGKPLNPPPSHEIWPFTRNSNDQFRKEERFSHTYPERFWPKQAQECIICVDSRRYGLASLHHHMDMYGIRYEYGDLMDVVELMRKDPRTRQAVLPVWFPEDTGVVHGERVPCSLTYQFLLREEMDIIYNIRSCDFVRHFADDVYMAGRLCHWMIEQLGLQGSVNPGLLVMNIGSLHCFQGDMPMLRKVAL